MKLSRLIMALVGGLTLTFLAVGLTFAAPAAQASGRVVSAALITPTITITPTVTPVPTVTVSHTHPVASAIAVYFRLPYTEVIALHDAGLGYGVIARAYLTAKASNGVLSPTAVLEMIQAGAGWGEIKHQYGIHPGGNGLGTIMSGHAEPGAALPPGETKMRGGPSVSPAPAPAINACPGRSCEAPGRKPDKPAKK